MIEKERRRFDAAVLMARLKLVNSLTCILPGGAGGEMGSYGGAREAD